MHICPHCNKLGIRSFNNPFSQGLADCRFCHNVSKVSYPKYAHLVFPIVLLLSIATARIIDSLPGLPHGAATPFALFWFLIYAFAGLFLVSRLTHYEKYEPKKPQPEEGKGSGAARTSLCLAFAALGFAAWPADEAQAQTPPRKGLEDAPVLGRHFHGKCGDLDVYQDSATGVLSGHAISYRYDRQAGIITFSIDGATATGFVDAGGHLTQLIDEHGEAHAPLTLLPDQARAAVARDKGMLAAMLDSCGEISVPRTKSCGPPVDQSVDPATGAPVAASGPPGVQTKDCIDDWTSPDYWAAYFIEQYPDPSFNITQTQYDCLVGKAQCKDNCTLYSMAGGAICEVAAYLGKSPAIGVACALGGFAYYSYCSQMCDYEWPC